MKKEEKTTGQRYNGLPYFMGQPQEEEEIGQKEKI